MKVCCSPIGVNSCAESMGSVWLAADARLQGSSTVVLETSVCNLATSHVTAVRYAWRESPCALRECSVYSSYSDNELPTPPFIYEGSFQ